MAGMRSDRAVKAAVDVDAFARDVARPGRAQERGQVSQVGRFAEVTQRDVLRELRAALGCRMQALVDLLAVDAAGRQAIDRDAVPPDLAREPLGPGVHAGLRRDGGV